MKLFPVQRFLSYARSFERLASSSKDGAFTEEQGADFAKLIDAYLRESDEYALSSTADQFRRIGKAVRAGETRKQIAQYFPDLLNRLEDECRRRKMLMIEPQHAQYLENPQFFDPSDSKAKRVSTEFPSAAEDIAEAGTCLACGRATACVMHLSRVIEVGLAALAKELGVTKQNDWGKYLQEIDTKLQQRLKTSGSRTPDEQFYAEVHITFDAVRRAWRNPTMHVEKTYTVERAEEVLLSVRSFMRHLATKLHE